MVGGVLLLNAIYSPLATESLSRWLSSQLPAPAERLEDALFPVAVLVVRGPTIAKANSLKAACHLKQHMVKAVYVSGHAPSTAPRVADAGVPLGLVACDLCARSTWENATLSNAWMDLHHPGAPVLMITDPWQLPRVAQAFFASQGLNVLPLAVSTLLSSR